ncbi:Wzz/FepE/Etk N-terminal domain-containing protein [Collimonas sp.]|jgi:hypothetical protein|uniref:Wzz/FepE/Etk N-terminal domain-containing protein n=1 Tax=Collimonas sp. TaxID=1963772 RepID=UPI002C174A35|nr:Wzz/FepE/Etk N-terminal domain-containing protein [Collimonas sp.]HWW08130.1 Wzz/FepE/Etk N-terminal domain-containing protein [Collimonas sp.]
MSNNFSNTTSSIPVEDAELIDLSAIWGSVKRHWIVLATCVIVCILVATALWSILPPKWRASATLQIGQLPTTSTALIETTGQVAEHLKQRQLQDQALESVGLPLNEDSDRRTNLFRKSLKAIPGKSTDFVDVNVAGFSQEEAKSSLNATLQALIRAHESLAAPMIKNLNERIEANTHQMTQATVEKARLEASLKNAAASPNGAKFEPSIVVINLLTKQDQLIRDLKTEHAGLADLDTKIKAFPTKVADAIFVPEQSFFPNLVLFLLGGLIIGTIAGIALALFRDRNLPKTRR